MVSVEPPAVVSVEPPAVVSVEPPAVVVAVVSLLLPESSPPQAATISASAAKPAENADSLRFRVKVTSSLIDGQKVRAA